MAVGGSAPHKRMPFDIDVPIVPFGAGAEALPRDFPLPVVAISSIIDIGRRLGRTGAELGASVGCGAGRAVL
ncbi:hypothetical protein U9M48_044936 [Paspalum notatum var. saurae]|uniref:Uncharacterized protein n=1 Tax=Paspalum notatum var. saurae TaxID=547442 RepID=A0AAQ3XI02_PASNO